jgi:hypothetical protein
MKRIIATVIALVPIALFGQSAGGENDFRKQVMFGVKAGVNISNVYDSQGEQFHANTKTGIAAGMFLSIPLSTWIGLQPEVLFSQKGFTGSGIYMSSPYELTRTTNYLDVPIFLAIKPSPFVTLLAGPQYSYLLKQEDTFTSGSATVLQEQTFENDNLRKNVMGFACGFDVNIQYMMLGFRTAWDVQTNNGDGSSSTPRYKNVWYQLTFGFRI